MPRSRYIVAGAFFPSFTLFCHLPLNQSLRLLKNIHPVYSTKKTAQIAKIKYIIDLYEIKKNIG